MNIFADSISIVKRYSHFFRDFFSEKDFIHFEKALTGYIAGDNKTISGINRMFFADKRSQSSMNRFFTDPKRDLEALNELRLKMLASQEKTKLKESGVISIDSTILAHKGDKFELIYRTYDYTEQRMAMCHDLLTLHYSDEDTDYPIYQMLWIPPDWEQIGEFLISKGIPLSEDKWNNRHSKGQTFRNYMRTRYKALAPKNPDLVALYKSKTYLAEDLIDKLVADSPDLKLPIAMDAGITCGELCNKIVNVYKRSYVGCLTEEKTIDDPRLKSTHKVKKKDRSVKTKEIAAWLRAEHAANPENSPMKKQSYTYQGKKTTAYCYDFVGRVDGYDHKVKIVVSFLKEDLSDKPNFIISNETGWSVSRILLTKRLRWPVEVYHQEGKEQGLEEYEVRNLKGIQTHISLITVAYSMLQSTIHDQEFQKELQTRLHTKPENTLSFLRRLMKAEAVITLVNFIISEVEQQKDVGNLLKDIISSIAFPTG